jgi:hypothetical protein
MKLSLSRIALALILSASFLQACSDSTSVEPAKEGKLVGGGASIIDLGRVAVGNARDTSIRISNTGSGDLVIASTSGSTAEISAGVHVGDTIRSGDYKDVTFHVVPADTGVRILVDSINYTTAGKTLTMALRFQVAVYRDVPGEGSTFSYSVVLTDTNGVSTPAPDQVLTIVANNLEYEGKTNVVEVADDAGSITYYHRDPNGDLSVYVDLSAAGAMGLSLPSGWYVIPLGSKTEIKQSLWDTTGITLPGVPVPVDVSVTSDATYTGAQNVVGAGQTFATQAGALKITVTISALGGLIKANQIETGNVWYSKDLQFPAKRSQVSQNIGSKKTSTTTWTIKSYDLK